MKATDFLTITKESEEEFRSIARRLFNSCAIQTKDALYRFIELEFYWKSPTHPDNSTYERKYVNPGQGEWFFHYSGVDIALRNDALQGFGGILIRGIMEVESGKRYKGPQVCAMKLFSGISAFGGDGFPQIIAYSFPDARVLNAARVNLGSNAKAGGFDKRFYRYLIKV